jgi:hypothetical protein
VQTEHLEAKAMGHNMLTINPAWSMAVITKFFGGGAQPVIPANALPGPL